MSELDKFEKIYNETITHANFLDKKSIISCMYQSYMMGKEECSESYDKLENTFEDLLETLSKEYKNISTKNEIINEWRLLAGLN